MKGGWTPGTTRTPCREPVPHDLFEAGKLRRGHVQSAPEKCRYSIPSTHSARLGRLEVARGPEVPRDAGSSDKVRTTGRLQGGLEPLQPPLDHLALDHVEKRPTAARIDNIDDAVCLEEAVIGGDVGDRSNATAAC